MGTIGGNAGRQVGLIPGRNVSVEISGPKKYTLDRKLERVARYEARSLRKVRKIGWSSIDDGGERLYFLRKPTCTCRS